MARVSRMREMLRWRCLLPPNADISGEFEVVGPFITLEDLAGICSLEHHNRAPASRFRNSILRSGRWKKQ